MQKVTLGGDRIGSGNKMKVDLHGYERSTHNLSKIWRSTMSAGTLVPFMKLVGLPGDTFDINLDCDILTHPTIGPLFGSFKVQLDIFEAPIRLYQGKLHNNALNIGRDMSSIKLPQLSLYAAPVGSEPEDADNAQINPSCLLSYLGIRGVGYHNVAATNRIRQFNGIPLLAYWDIYKNYYANKQEEIGAAINTPVQALVDTITGASTTAPGQSPIALPEDDPTNGIRGVGAGTEITFTYSGATPIPSQILLFSNGQWVNLTTLFSNFTDAGTELRGFYTNGLTPTTIESWRMINFTDLPLTEIQVSTFPLSNIDDMRNEILVHSINSPAFDINSPNLPPYNYVAWNTATPPTIDQVQIYKQSQQGLGLKTYQSDLFNNWLSTDWIDGAGGINEITAISTAGGSFTIDTLNLSKKVYDMLNRIAVSDGSYGAWLSATYDHSRFIGIESPVYHGGLIKELVFQEVLSQSLSEDQPLGTLAGKGTMGKKHKGGSVHIKCNEPCYIIGIISLTPRIDYSQGNHWDTHLETMDDFHKPALDGIGFQELITEQMAWWSTHFDAGWITKSAGKQPAWINYMTDYNETRGNFAITGNEMFMTLNRRYEFQTDGFVTPSIKDLTTYIDPSKFNFIFAQTSIDSQNFWTQIAMDVTARRKMSAKVMPNL